MSTATERARRDEAVNRAYTVQVIHGCKSAAMTGAFGLGVVTLAHYAWPTFRRQTLPFKAFLVTIFATAGLVIGADNALLSHEAELRRSEQVIRRLAVMELSRQGLVPTETAIARWRDERARQEATSAKTHV
ncbi:hypothetical protein EV363DRAFT_1313360 [Boletus edulis]|uniref:HIG1 domain-containing protein n=1 Tax=Boletus edulis BED1 TaxID=1328754 RepID=A0AAD4C7Q0_BOLED|nr:hypothetical protein EV363DRAFT_1313360 [Boletus edulis]KAF8450812.1 hypothetical protein L210DRAFT_3521283 [Boletus edulis BED1]